MKRINHFGFTLIEVLIALFVLTVVLLSLSAVVVSVMRATVQSEETATATTLMQDKIESLKNASFSSLSSGSDVITLGGITYNRRWDITTVDTLKMAIVTVDWTSRGSHSTSTTTLRGE